MKISVNKLELTLARQCRTISSLRDGVSSKTIDKIKKGFEVNPVTVGRIANALGVDVEEIIDNTKL